MTESALRSLASAVFGGRCGLGVVSFESADPASLPGVERTAIRSAVPARAREFAAGRQAARIAMGRSDAIPMGVDRAPLWPLGWVGSISHCAGWALAVARRGRGLIGVDLETDDALPVEVVTEILTPAEREVCAGDLRVARRFFAIKEAVYKAQYPASGVIFDFQTLEVSVIESRFSARFQRTVGPFGEGHSISGIWASGGGFLLAGVNS